jgi:hypothetical protein
MATTRTVPDPHRSSLHLRRSCHARCVINSTAAASMAILPCVVVTLPPRFETGQRHSGRHALSPRLCLDVGATWETGSLTFRRILTLAGSQLAGDRFRRGAQFRQPKVSERSGFLHSGTFVLQDFSVVKSCVHAGDVASIEKRRSSRA